jgi:hypothetical protein
MYLRGLLSTLLLLLDKRCGGGGGGGTKDKRKYLAATRPTFIHSAKCNN